MACQARHGRRAGLLTLRRSVPLRHAGIRREIMIAATVKFGDAKNWKFAKQTPLKKCFDCGASPPGRSHERGVMRALQ